MEKSKMSPIPYFIVIGGSAGSLQALFGILAGLNPAFSIPVLLVMHRMTGFDSTLEESLTTRTHLVTAEVEEKEPIRKGYLYICPPDYHVLIEPDETFSLDSSEKINFSRPSLDVVYKSAADAFGKRLIAVILSGANADGAEGMRCVQEKGGITIVQDPGEALVSYMPQMALKHMKPDHILPSRRIGELLNNAYG